MKDRIRHIIGYAIGFSVFILLIPFAIFKLSVYFGIHILHNIVIQSILAVPILIVGIIFAIWSNIMLLHVGKGGPTDVFGMAVSPRTKKLVTVGPYKYSRNPMVLGAVSIYSGLSVLFDSPPCFIIVLVFLFIAVIYLKLTEEKRLLMEFGDEFVNYKSTVPMIVPAIKTRSKRC